MLPWDLLRTLPHNSLSCQKTSYYIKSPVIQPSVIQYQKTEEFNSTIETATALESKYSKVFLYHIYCFIPGIFVLILHLLFFIFDAYHFFRVSSLAKFAMQELKHRFTPHLNGGSEFKVQVFLGFPKSSTVKEAFC